ncbi:hypothetical protein J2X52_002536 [Luteimonas sp. 3794]|nr:hypothetical protein [Luteimonas sp. 3794]
MSAPLILGSTSAYRRALLDRLRLPFTCARPAVDETPRDGEAPHALAVRLALAKAEDVSMRMPGAWVIGSDQVAALEGRPLGKPGGREAAIAQLTSMSGRRVVFHTALALAQTGQATLEPRTAPTSSSARSARTRSRATSMPNSRSTARAVSNARGSASHCSTRSTARIRPHWSGCRSSPPRGCCATQATPCPDQRSSNGAKPWLWSTSSRAFACSLRPK